jgi:hypothetical protein
MTSLQQELKKKKPFDMPEQEALLNLLRTADQLQIRFARLFRRFGLTRAGNYRTDRPFGNGGPRLPQALRQRSPRGLRLHQRQGR